MLRVLKPGGQLAIFDIFHAGTSRANGEWVTGGGRVLGVTATGEDLDVALSRCYGAVGEIQWDGMQYRRDIGRG